MHVPVLLKEVIELLNPQPNENFVDCTYGFGGHAAAILQKTGPAGKVLGIEIDEEKVKNQKLKIKSFSERIILVNGSYADLEEIVNRENFGPINGILLDLGMSSWDVEESGRGFSFNRNEPLDMRYSAESQKIKVKSDVTAQEIVNGWREEELARIFRDFGQERFYRGIAEKIARARAKKPIKTTFQLTEIIKSAIPKKFHFGKTHPATRTFQALRIAVNNELGNLAAVLPQALEALEKEGRLAVISFHSLEDKIVKNFFREKAKQGQLTILTKKPSNAQKAEINNNPRARSAKLRAIVRI